MVNDKRGYYSHFKHIVGANGDTIDSPRKRFTSESVAQAMLKKMGNSQMTVFYCSYCNGYHIGKKN